jgi:hypothetical protein
MCLAIARPSPVPPPDVDLVLGGDARDGGGNDPERHDDREHRTEEGACADRARHEHHSKERTAGG